MGGKGAGLSFSYISQSLVKCHWGQEEEGQCKLLDTSALLKWRLCGSLLKRAAGMASQQPMHTQAREGGTQTKIQDSQQFPVKHELYPLQ